MVDKDVFFEWTSVTVDKDVFFERASVVMVDKDVFFESTSVMVDKNVLFEWTSAMVNEDVFFEWTSVMVNEDVFFEWASIIGGELWQLKSGWIRVRVRRLNREGKDPLLEGLDRYLNATGRGKVAGVSRWVRRERAALRPPIVSISNARPGARFYFYIIYMYK